jgi:hypothetical protein
MTRVLLAAALLAAGRMPAAAQDVTAEYRVKAAYLYNFVQYVEWPATESSAPLTICVAGRNPFGAILENLVRGEVVSGRRLEARVILEPDRSCAVVFVPEGAATTAYLRGARGQPMLTIGESAGFIGLGGIARFYIDGGKVRFEINPAAAEAQGLRISSRLLRLARIVGPPGTAQ